MFKKVFYFFLINILYFQEASALVSYKDKNYSQASTDYNFFNVNSSSFSGFSPLLIILNVIATIFLYIIIAKALKSYVSYQCNHGVLAEDKKISKNIFSIVLMFIYCLLILRINFNYL
ncbi:hypothetical protein K9M42_01870 [Patescibacteria group bacterium]|nr:hypothetical protein [Patescibacteria group bacterium]